jgi:hypothetical protein
MRYPSSDYDRSRLLLWQVGCSVSVERDPELRALGLILVTNFRLGLPGLQSSIDFARPLAEPELAAAMRRIRELVPGDIQELAPAPRRFFAACASSPCAAQNLKQRAWAAYPPGWHLDALGTDRQPGQHAVDIAVLDSGADLSHPSLANLIKPLGVQALTDGVGHGTHIASTICARPWGPPPPAVYDDSYDLNFVPPGILPEWQIRLANIAQFARRFEVDWNLYMQAIETLTQVPKILNLSIGGPAYSIIEREALGNLANTLNVLITASAGNNGNRVLYPAGYIHCLSVGASTRDTPKIDFPFIPWSANNDTLNSFERQTEGLPAVDVYAPGRNIAGADRITALNLTRPAIFRTGTSMATAYATGAFGLRYSRLGPISKPLIDARTSIAKLSKLSNGGHHLVNLAAQEFFKP